MVASLRKANEGWRSCVCFCGDIGTVNISQKIFLEELLQSLEFKSTRADSMGCTYKDSLSKVFHICRVRNVKFSRNLKFATCKAFVNSMKKMMLCLKVGIFQFNSFALLYIQQISPRFILFIGISTCGEFQICDEF